MAAQLTLFGKVSKVAPYLKVAKDEYQKFVKPSTASDAKSDKTVSLNDTADLAALPKEKGI